ncbi:MAG: phosphatidate cytidylyltransferase [Thermomicrobiales bacterium]
MQRRLIGSVVVVAVGLLPALIGGPAFALLMVTIGIVALREFLALGRESVTPATRWCLHTSLVLAAGGALLTQPALLLLAVLLAVFVSLIISLRSINTPGAAGAWSWGVAGACYAGTPVLAAIALRQAAGSEVAATWQALADRLAAGWTPAPVGMAWVLAVVLATWASDSTAYLAGRAFGRHKLAPAVSPGKTIEGALGGLIAAIVASAAVFGVSGTLPAWTGAIVGAGIGVCGQLGDLSESFLKRQASVKDSGHLIPGHGGMLDRVDALLFAFPAAWLMFWIAEGYLR